MDILHLVFRYIHLLGFAMLFGGWLTAFVSSRLSMNPAMVWGSALQVATGIILSAPMTDEELNYPKIGVKLLLGLLIAVMIWIPHLKQREATSKGHFIGIGAMIAITAGVAVFWT
ncbi:MAG: hypothetical protein ACRDXX_21285 [Stackebrandtia sp.]